MEAAKNQRSEGLSSREPLSQTPPRAERDDEATGSTTYVDDLTEEVCRHLLNSEQVGRVAFVDEDGFPAVLPVNYLVDGGLVVFRTALGAKYEAVPLHRVAFEVDHIDAATSSGWSVLVRGYGQVVTNAVGARYEALRRRRLDTWAPGPKEHWVSIDIDRITGRRIVRSIDQL